MVAVGFLRSGGLGGPSHGEPGKDQGGNVGEVVHGVADESDGMSGVTGYQFDGYQREGGYDCGAKRESHALSGKRNVRMAG